MNKTEKNLERKLAQCGPSGSGGIQILKKEHGLGVLALQEVTFPESGIQLFKNLKLRKLT